MLPAKPRARVAIAFARNFASGLIQNAEPAWQDGTTLTIEEMALVEQELVRISERIEDSINQDALALAAE